MCPKRASGTPAVDQDDPGEDHRIQAAHWRERTLHGQKRCVKRCTVRSLAIVSSGVGSTPGGRTGGEFGAGSDMFPSMRGVERTGFSDLIPNVYTLGLVFFGRPFLWKTQGAGLVVSLRSLVALSAGAGLGDSN